MELIQFISSVVAYGSDRSQARRRRQKNTSPPTPPADDQLHASSLLSKCCVQLKATVTLASVVIMDGVDGLHDIPAMANAVRC